ncbi:META domain-containing protein [Microvirga arsenatis]|uniref:META domain-containing protein n=1 Tax=Microvirga arsenatis TaxID=2692265 RepID=A0ABW9Z0R6_9HYPH|nr:META domain-containing protein [Microvirga arsenatis]NBJ12511.1 META domain-containing protein [Microvirga arsenatis]NBJ26251.1 META domain-containing protein [Microvirga arsenatis]
MIALRLAALLAALAAVSGAQAQTAATLGRPVGPTRQVDPKVPQPGQGQAGKVFPLNSSWVAISLNGKPFSGERPSFRLDDQLRATGFSGCNTYATAAYPLRDQGLAVGPFALTKKSCDKGTMAIEQAFLMALRSSGKWDIQGRNLIIRTQNGGELRFERSL